MARRIKVIEGAYFQDLQRQPEAVRDTVGVLRQTKLRSLGKYAKSPFVLTGMGSSLHALYTLSTRLNREGLRAAMVESGELIRYHADSLRGSALVVVSQSGRSAEIVRLVKRPRPDCLLIAVTNSLDSPLAKKADVVVPMAAGEESTVSCKTYVATLTALAWLGDFLCGTPGRTLPGLEKAADEMQAYLAGWRSHVDALVERLRGVDHLFLAGRGSSQAAACTGGLITKESAHFHAEGMSAPQFRHGPFEMLSSRVLVLVFAGDKETRNLNLRLAADVREAGGQSEVIGEQADSDVFRLPMVPDRARPLLEILPVQMMTLALSAMAGREAGHFERATKITDIE